MAFLRAPASPRAPAGARRRLGWLELSLLAVGLIVIGLAFSTAGTALAVPDVPEKPDVIVVLASHEWERLPVAARLAKEFPGARVLLSTPTVITKYTCHSCAGRVGWLVRAGVPRKQVVVLSRPVGATLDEAVSAYDYVALHEVRSLVVVTSPYHGRRALATFRKVFEPTPVRIGLRTAIRESGATPARWWERPYDRWYVAYEWAAVVWYAVRFGV